MRKFFSWIQNWWASRKAREHEKEMYWQDPRFDDNSGPMP